MRSPSLCVLPANVVTARSSFFVPPCARHVLRQCRNQHVCFVVERHCRRCYGVRRRHNGRRGQYGYERRGRQRHLQPEWELQPERHFYGVCFLDVRWAVDVCASCVCVVVVVVVVVVRVRCARLRSTVRVRERMGYENKLLVN